jgi:predicted ATPase
MAAGTTVPHELSLIARNFIRLQQHRHEADYDIAKQWSRTDVLNALALASDAFTAWRAVSHLDAAQDFLLQLFLPKPPRQ